MAVLGEGLILPLRIIIDRILFVFIFQFVYKAKFKKFGRNVKWGRHFLWRCIPKGVRISSPELISIGDNCQIDEGVYLQCHKEGDGIELVENVRINAHTHILSYSKIIIGKNVLIAPYSLITSSNHGKYENGKPIMFRPMSRAGEVCIKEGAWIAQNSLIVGPCEIGENSIVGAGAIVKGHHPSQSLLVGVLANNVRKNG